LLTRTIDDRVFRHFTAAALTVHRLPGKWSGRVNGSGLIPESIASQLVGVWKLVNYTVEQEGQENSPFGPEPAGFLIYTPEGFVSAQLMRPGRPLFQGHDWQGADEYQQAGSDYIAYCGRQEETAL
jgi:hypothetical protein